MYSRSNGNGQNVSLRANITSHSSDDDEKSINNTPAAPILLTPRPPPAIAVAEHPSTATTAVPAQLAPARDYLLPATTTITTTSATKTNLKNNYIWRF